MESLHILKKVISSPLWIVGTVPSIEVSNNEVKANYYSILSVAFPVADIPYYLTQELSNEPLNL